MRICYECGKEIQNQKEMVMKEFRVADWGVRWIKPFHAECWQKRRKSQKKNHAKVCFALLSVLTCICAVFALWALL